MAPNISTRLMKSGVGELIDSPTRGRGRVSKTFTPRWWRHGAHAAFLRARPIAGSMSFGKWVRSRGVSVSGWL